MFNMMPHQCPPRLVKKTYMPSGVQVGQVSDSNVGSMETKLVSSRSRGFKQMSGKLKKVLKSPAKTILSVMFILVEWRNIVWSVFKRIKKREVPSLGFPLMITQCWFLFKVPFGFSLHYVNGIVQLWSCQCPILTRMVWCQKPRCWSRTEMQAQGRGFLHQDNLLPL